MAIALAALQPGVAVAAADTTIITATGNTKVSSAVFANIGASATTLSVSIKRNGGSAVVLIPPRNVAAGATDLAPEMAGIVLLSGDVVTAKAGAAASINAFANGYTA